MCQLNVFLIFRKIPIDSVMSLMDDFGIDGECITNDFESNELSSIYNFYISPSYRCHCNSFVTNFSNEEYKGIDLVNKLTKQHNDELKILYEMKEFMSSNTYLEEKESFINIYEELQAKVINIENEFFNRHSHSNDFNSNLKDEIKKSSLHKEFREFLSKNSMMYDSLMRYSKDFNQAADDLGDLIKNAEAEKFKYEQEYIQLRDWILNVIDKYGNIMYFSYWQDNSIPKIQSTRKITINQISFELFARLKYLELLDISK
ncbi:hypothetical protein RJI07_03635 [Mycoplasmatota bacterium WC30]